MKMIKKIILLFVLILTIIAPLSPSEFEQLWGMSKSDLIARFKLKDYSTFKPEDHPEYNNRIIKFFNSMNSDGKTAITILRIDGKPETDYCFFNEKLYSVSEEWGNVEKGRANDLLKSIECSYSSISTEKKNPDIIYSFKKNKTKVLLYTKFIDDKSVRLKVFYYSTDLFSMMLFE